MLIISVAQMNSETESRIHMQSAYLNNNNKNTKHTEQN